MAGFMTGKGARCVLFLKGDKLEPLDVESWELGPNVTTINDGVCGEDRDRLDREINYYTLRLTCFNATAAKLQAMLRYDASGDNNSQQSVDFGLKLTDKTNGQTLFQTQEGVIDDWRWTAGGRTERQKIDIPIRVRYVEEAT